MLVIRQSSAAALRRSIYIRDEQAQISSVEAQRTIVRSLRTIDARAARGASFWLRTELASRNLSKREAEMPRPTQREEPLQVLARMAEIRKANKRKPHWECEVDVYLQPPGSDPRFHLQTCMETDGDGRIVLRNRRRPGFIIKFRLRNAKHYRFPVDPLAAVWSKRGYVCPEDPIWQIFRPFAVDQKGKTLSVYAENPTPAGGNFEYVLRVRNNNNGSILRLDPGGTENNGASH